jgi:sensor histidine kinase YesM
MKQNFRRSGMVLVVSGLLGMVLYAYLHYSEIGNFPGKTRVLAFALGFVGGAIMGYALFLLNHQLDRWLPWRLHYFARFTLGYISNVVAAYLMACAIIIAMLRVWPHDTFWTGFSLADEDMAIKVFILLLTTLFIYNVIYALLYSYQQYAVAQIETLQRERKQLELQFEALKSQISPHYLFNSLNTISSLVYKDPQSAEQFIRRLAQTYQYILSTQNKQFVLLKEEVEFVQSYYYLLRIRFQQQLSVEVNLPSTIMNSRIPPLTLQILVENAVKHNNLGGDKKLFIYITAQDNTHVRVINTKTGNINMVQSFKVGLENIRKRYEFFTDKKIEIKDEEKFTVSLPVIQSKQERTEHKFSA